MHFLPNWSSLNWNPAAFKILTSLEAAAIKSFECCSLFSPPRNFFGEKKREKEKIKNVFWRKKKYQSCFNELEWNA